MSTLLNPSTLNMCIVTPQTLGFFSTQARLDFLFKHDNVFISVNARPLNPQKEMTNVTEKRKYKHYKLTFSKQGCCVSREGCAATNIRVLLVLLL